MSRIRTFAICCALLLVATALPAAVRAQEEDHHDEDGHDHEHEETPDTFNCSCHALAEHEAEEAAAQQLAATCALELATWEQEQHDKHETTAGEWVSGVAASLVVSLLSLIGVATFSFVPNANRDHALQALLGLAFGTLIGGTFLDLLPETAEALGKFDVGVSAVCMCGIIFGYLTERLTHWVSGGTHSHSHGGDGGSAGHGHGHSHGGAASHEDDLPGGHGNHHDHEHDHHPHKPMAHDGMGTAKQANGANGHANGDIELRAVSVQGGAASPAPAAAPTIAAVPADADPLAFSREADPHLASAAPATKAPAPAATTTVGAVANGDSKAKETDAIAAVPKSSAEFKPSHMKPRGGALFGLTPLAILSLSGDAIHNFIDGLVIGAAFVSSINTGIVTAVAVAVHEIPQEIGDFGILLQSGLTVKQALLANFGVAVTCIVGTIITLALGEQLGDNANYALPFAGGVFLYLALSGVVPEMQRYIAAEDRDESERREQGRPSGRLSCCRGSFVMSMTALAAAGICIGIALMGLLTLLPHEHGHSEYEPSALCATVNAAAVDSHAGHSH